MKGTFFNKPLEWNLETKGESWKQGDSIQGTLKVKNHGPEAINLNDTGVGLCYADIKKVQSRAENSLKAEQEMKFEGELSSGEEKSLDFQFTLSSNGPVSDKKTSHYLSYGRNLTESQLQLKVEPMALYSKILGLMDTFHRFKLKDFKNTKKGVEFKLIPPTSRDMANLESLLLIFGLSDKNLDMTYDFQVKKLDTSAPTTKINKESVTVKRSLPPKEYSFGGDMINQDQLLKSIGEVLSEVKLKAVF